MIHEPMTVVPAGFETLYETAEGLAEYLADVRARREQRSSLQKLREHLQDAIQKITAELVLAEQDQDAEIERELCAVLMECQQRLSLLRGGNSNGKPLLRTVSPGVDTRVDVLLFAEARSTLLSDTLDTLDTMDTSASAPPLTLKSTGAGLMPLGEILSSVMSFQRVPPPIVLPELPPSKSPDHSFETAVVSTPIIPTATVKTLAPFTPEQEKQFEILREALTDIALQWEAIDRAGLRGDNRELNRPRCFEMRSLACTLGALAARARDCGVNRQPLSKEIGQLRNKMSVARTYANEAYDSLPFEDKYWTAPDSGLSVAEWQELALHYGRTSQAQMAWNWYATESKMPATDTALQTGEALPLLNAIAAVQQALYRTLYDLGGSDRLQTDLYGNLRDAARETDYLTMLSPDAPFEALEAVGATLPDMLHAAQRELTDSRTRADKEARKERALTDMTDFFKRYPTPGSIDSNLTQDREALLPLLDACVDAGIPVSNVQIRNGLLQYGQRLLAGHPKYSRILEGVCKERERKGLDAAPPKTELPLEDDFHDAVSEEKREKVALFVSGQKILILGGTARLRVCEELEQKLAGVSVKWLPSVKSDKSSKFRSEIEKADIVLLAKNFVSHEISEKGSEWVKSKGGHFLFLLGGYGANRIIHDLYEYLTVKGNRGP